MRAVCGDAMNSANCPTPEQLKDLGADGVRIVYFDEPDFEDYYQALRQANLQVAVVLSGESFPDSQYGQHASRIATQFAQYPPEIPPPDLWLLGNEPSAARGAESSWPMSPDEYRDFWNLAAPAIRAILPEAQLYVGGMLGPAGWLDPIWDQLDPTPDGIDVHYPDTEAELLGWAQHGVPLSVMEWCWAGDEVLTADVVDWQHMLDRTTTSNAWFSWGYDETMALRSPQTGEPLKAYGDYQAALAG